MPGMRFKADSKKRQAIQMYGLQDRGT